MAEKKTGRVVIAGRFPAGCVAQLWRVASEAVLTHAGGELVDTKKADENGLVTFKTGVEVGARYIAFGYVAGVPTQVRAIGVTEDAVAEHLSQQPVQPDEAKHADGQLVSGVWSPRRYPQDTAYRDSDEDGEVTPVAELKGKELAARAAAAGVSSKLTVEEKRAAIAEAEAVQVGA